MPIRVVCQCGKTLNAPDQFAGRKGTCKACGAALVIPLPVVHPKGAPDDVKQAAPTTTAPLYEASPSMFRNRPVHFVVGVGLIVAPFVLIIASPILRKWIPPEHMVLLALGSIVACPVAALLMLRWWLRCLGTKLTITPERITLRSGLLSRSMSEVHTADVRNVMTSQTIFQRLFDVGSVGVSTAGQSGVEIMVGGIPAPLRVREIINANRK